ncbi:MAG: UDP-N-acetylmuramate dehydrogenase [Bacteroidales bacterium]|nr:UDP-N-acetylmuramate dehydrogenase [Bacteroidales bacterium]
MKTRYNYPLRRHNTFGINTRAKRYISLDTAGEIYRLIMREEALASKHLILGGGSNILFTGDFEGTVIHPLFNKIRTIKTVGDNVLIAAEAGLEWDRLVEWAVDNDLGGLENLSYIPGMVGAAPIQNIGAYGAEVSGLITAVHAVSLDNARDRVFTAEECMFAYRDSIFKHELKDKYLITKVDFSLKRSPVTFNLAYGNLEKEACCRGKISLQGIREAVIKIRREKLPDPSVRGNAGSFFKNPVVSERKYTGMKRLYPDLPSWHAGPGQYKLAAAWLIEKAGWKGKRSGGAAVHDKHALVLVNTGKATGREILELSDMITTSVRERFGIRLAKEVNIV